MWRSISSCRMRHTYSDTALSITQEIHQETLLCTKFMHVRVAKRHASRMHIPLIMYNSAKFRKSDSQSNPAPMWDEPFPRKWGIGFLRGHFRITTHPCSAVLVLARTARVAVRLRRIRLTFIALIFCHIVVFLVRYSWEHLFGHYAYMT